MTFIKLLSCLTCTIALVPGLIDLPLLTMLLTCIRNFK